MKRIVSIILVVVCLTCVTLTGCNSNNEPQQTETNQGSENGVIKIDPFEHVYISSYGKNGEATLDGQARAFIRIGDFVQDTYLEVVIPENNGSIKNGDLIHVSIKEEIDYDLLAQNGIEFTRTEADIEMRGLNAYGQADASNGEPVIVNLNDYVGWNVVGEYNGDAYLQMTINYMYILKEHTQCLSENVAADDLLTYDSSWQMASYLLQFLPPVSVIGPDYNCEVSYSFTNVFGDGFSNGDVVKLSWQVNEENLAMLQKVMNVEFVYEDFTVTIDGLKQAE